MRINLIADDSVSSAPAGFTAAVQTAASVFEKAIPGNYSVNITYGWGTFDNVANSSISPSNPSYFSIGGADALYYVSYGTLKNLLTSSAKTSQQITAVASLPAVSPFATNSYVWSSSQEKALGVFTGSSSIIDGSIGFNTDDAPGGVLSSFTESAAITEIAHALGLTSGDGPNTYALDLYRYASPGVRYSDTHQPDYFSIDGGNTDLANYDTTGFDPTLFVNLSNDPLSLQGQNTGLTSLDLEALDAMGFAGSSNLFGTFTYDVTSPAGEIDALYQAILNRPGDAGGLEGYTAQAANGTSLTAIAQDLLGSAEYANDYGSSTQSDSSFVNQLYVDALHRQADPGGLTTYDNALASGLSRSQLAVVIATSPESQNDLAPTFQAGVFVQSATDTAIAQLYYGLLDRAPDATGLAGWEVDAAQGAPLVDIASAFVNSPEYAALHGAQTNAQFVTSLYNGALGRDPDVGGANTYTTALNGGTSRSSVALAFAESTEANRHLAPLIQGNFNLA